MILPFHQFTITVSRSQLDEVITWCSNSFGLSRKTNTLPGKWSYTLNKQHRTGNYQVSFFFKNETDAMLFSLRWQ